MEWEEFFRGCVQTMQPYQPGLREEQIREIVQTEQIYKLSSNESPLPPFPGALQAMTANLAMLNEYPEGSCHQLRQALSAHYGVPAAQILAGNGTNELLTCIAESCLEPGDNVVYSWPSFIVYRYAAQLMGAEYREVALAANGAFALEEMLARIDSRTKIVYVCSPNNPSGVSVGADALADFLERVPAHVLVVLDAAYDEFVQRDDRLCENASTRHLGLVPESKPAGQEIVAERPHERASILTQPDGGASAAGEAPAAAQAPTSDQAAAGVSAAKEAPAAPLDYYDGVRPLVVLKTFSKAYALAGIRVGYGFAPEPLVQAVDRVREPFNVNAVAQAAGVASLADQAELARRMALNAACRSRLQAGFAKIGLTYYPSQANFVWVQVPQPQQAFDALLQRGVIVRPVPGADALRVGVGDEAGTTRTLEVFRELFG